jgi:hypothetical protein
MATIEEVMQLQSQGMSDSDIIKKMRDEGISPKEINDALAQVKIKSAVQEDQAQEASGMEQSIMQPDGQEQTQELEQYAPQQPQPYYQDYQPVPQAVDMQTISEIAEQVVSDKFKEFEQKTGDIAMFRTSVQEKIQDFNERLKRIENSIDKIQQAIIGKIGEYGENMTYVHKDMENLHNTMSKMMNPLMDNYNELRKISGKK